MYAKARDELGQRIVFARDGVQNQTVNLEASLIGVYTLRFYLAISSSTICTNTILSLKVLHPGGWGESVGQRGDGVGDHEGELGHQEDHHHHGLCPGGQCTLLHGP